MSILFKTERLSICPIHLPLDYGDLLALHNHPVTMQWIPNNKSPWTLADLEAKYQMNQTLYDKKIGLYKIIWEEAGIRITIGEIGLFPCGDAPTHIEVGYILHQTYWKRGFATELLCGVEQFAQQHLAYTHIRAQLFESNINSKKLLERCSFLHLASVSIDAANTKLIYSKSLVDPFI